MDGDCLISVYVLAGFTVLTYVGRNQSGFNHRVGAGAATFPLAEKMLIRGRRWTPDARHLIASQLT